MLRSIRITMVLGLVLMVAGCGHRSPKRDSIPILKNQLFRLQEAVKAKNRAAIDSLLAPQILEKKESSDSLLSFVYGPDGSFDFTQFGQADIAYTNDKARIDAYIMDSTRAVSRPIVFFLAEQNKMWLFTSFEVGEQPVDTTGDTIQADMQAAESLKTK